MKIAAFAIALIAFALWAGADGITNGKEIVLLAGVLLFLVWSEAGTRHAERTQR